AGTIVTVVASLLPALRASRIPPIAAMRDATTPDKPLTKLTIAGAIPTLVGVAAVGTALFRDLGDYGLWTLMAGILMVFVGVAMQKVPGVSQAVAIYQEDAQVGKDVIPVQAADAATLASVFTLQPTAGRLRMLRTGEVIVDDAFAKNRKLSVGSTLELTTQRG